MTIIGLGAAIYDNKKTKLTDEDIERLKPKMSIGVFYDNKDKRFNPPLERYNLSISNSNKNSASVVNFQMRVAFKDMVQEINPQLHLTYGRNFTAEVLAIETPGTDGEKFHYLPDTSQSLEDHNISISIQEVIVDGKKQNTNIVSFYCKEFPTDALFWAFITVNPLVTHQQLLSNIADGTYEGTYDYYIDGKKFTEKIKGAIKDVKSSEEKTILDNYEEVIKGYDKAIENDPNSLDAWFSKAIALKNLGKYEEALDAINKVIELNMEQATAWHLKGYILTNLKRYKDAIVAYDKTIEISPQDEIAWSNKGFALKELKKYEEALVSYNKAIEINPQNAKNWHGKGIILGYLGKYEEALASFNKAIEINPQYVKVWSSKGALLYDMERYKDASEAFKNAQKIDPTFLIPNWQMLE